MDTVKRPFESHWWVFRKWSSQASSSGSKFLEESICSNSQNRSAVVTRRKSGANHPVWPARCDSWFVARAVHRRSVNLYESKELISSARARFIMARVDLRWFAKSQVSCNYLLNREYLAVWFSWKKTNYLLFKFTYVYCKTTIKKVVLCGPLWFFVLKPSTIFFYAISVKRSISNKFSARRVCFSQTNVA